MLVRRVSSLRFRAFWKLQIFGSPMRRLFVVVVMLLAAGFVNASAFGQNNKFYGNKVVITKVAVDSTTHRITVTGENFLGSNGRTMPTVLLGRRILNLVM